MELKKFQKQSKSTREETAIALGINKKNLDNYIDERCEPDIPTLIKLADYYHTTIDALVGRQTNNNLVISYEKRELHEMIEQLNENGYFRAKIYVSGLLAGQM